MSRLGDHIRNEMSKNIEFHEVDEERLKSELAIISFRDAYDVRNYMKNNIIEKYYFAYKPNNFRAFKLISTDGKSFVRVFWKRKWYNFLF